MVVRRLSVPLPGTLGAKLDHRNHQPRLAFGFVAETPSTASGFCFSGTVAELRRLGWVVRKEDTGFALRHGRGPLKPLPWTCRGAVIFHRKGTRWGKIARLIGIASKGT